MFKMAWRAGSQGPHSLSRCHVSSNRRSQRSETALRAGRHPPAPPSTRLGSLMTHPGQHCIVQHPYVHHTWCVLTRKVVDNNTGCVHVTRRVTPGPQFRFCAATLLHSHHDLTRQRPSRGAPVDRGSCVSPQCSFSHRISPVTN